MEKLKNRINSTEKRNLKLTITNPSTPISGFKTLTSFSNTTSPQSQPMKTSLNKHPFSNTSHRLKVRVDLKKANNLNIKQKQFQLKNYFSLLNSKQKALTHKILSAQDKNLDAIVENNDSFNERYSPIKHKFSHKLIGEVQLPRKFFNMIPQERELEIIKHVDLKKKVENIEPTGKVPDVTNINKASFNKPKERLRKALTAINHFKEMKINPIVLHKISEILPGVPYGLPKSKELLIACKEGNTETLNSLLESNKWLAHIYDNSGQSGLHWSVKRNHTPIVKSLLEAGAWVDTTDYVIPI
jgi:hypothetical protein